MARRTMRDSRAAIFRAAALEFAERGYEAAGTDRIATRARVNKAMLYYHFGSKGRAVRRSRRATWSGGAARVAQSRTPRIRREHRLDSWVSALVEEAAARPWFPPIMLRELAARAPHFDATTFHMMNAVLAGVTDVIAQGKREGAFRDVDPLLAHLSMMPRSSSSSLDNASWLAGSFAADSPSRVSSTQFVRHMQASVRGMLRKTS